MVDETNDVDDATNDAGSEPEVETHAVAVAPEEVTLKVTAVEVQEPSRSDVEFKERAPLSAVRQETLILPEPVLLDTRRISQRTIDEMAAGKKSIAGW